MVRFKLCLLLLVFLACSTSAKLYSQAEIDVVTNSEVALKSNKNFVNDFFTAKDPQVFIENFINSNEKSNDFLKIEYKLFTLLEEISYQPKQDFLQEFVAVMKEYQQKAKKMHTEGRLAVPVYQLNSKARGIENIWLADTSFNKYQILLNKNPVETLLRLKNTLSDLSQPEWLGLKKSINDVTIDNHIKISDFLLQDYSNMQGLDKFVSHYALMTNNQNLTSIAINNLDLSSREYLLRKLSAYFAADFTIQQLLQAIEINKSKALAVTLLQPYMDKENVQLFLIESLKDKQIASQAAFVLSHSKHEDTILKLEKIYSTSQSSQQRQQIVFILKLNQQSISKQILKRLKIKDETSKNWLVKFNRSIK